jgi:hypothetical protein
MRLMERIKAHAQPELIRRIEVPEWGEEGKPLVITYSMVSLDDLAIVTELDGQEWNKRAARIVAMKACDEAGVRLFTMMDAIELRKLAAPEVVSSIAMRMFARTSAEEAEKN